MCGHAILGALLGTVFDTINYAWIKTLPTGFFYLCGDFWYSILGGNAVYYLGTYSYGATITKNENRANILARFNAIELAGWVLGSLVSPSIFNYLGYYGSYSIYLSCCVLALIHLYLFVLEPIKKKMETGKEKNETSNFFRKIFVNSFIQMVQTLLKKRPGPIRCLLFLQLISYFFLWFNYQYENMEYLYMTKVLHGFDENNYAYYYAAKQSLQGLFIIFVMPKLKIHPSLFCIISLSLQSLSYFMLPWLKEVWMYFTAQILMLAYYGTWASARTLFTYCVHKNEIGKIYASVGIVASIAPLLSNPAYRTLYNLTIDNFPGAIFLLAGFKNIAIVVIFAIIFMKRSNFGPIQSNIEEAISDHRKENIEVTNVSSLD